MKAIKLFIFSTSFMAFLFTLVNSGFSMEIKPAQTINVTKRKQNWWLEIWGDAGYQRTNAWYESQKNFGISVLAPKAGYRIYLSDFFFIDPYVKADLMRDLGNQEQNMFFWHNNVKYGLGVRLRLEHKRAYQHDKLYRFRFNYANINYFAEYMGIYFMDRGQKISTNIPRGDIRTGLNSWISADNKISLSSYGITGGIWFEMWSNLVYHSTNFFLVGKDNFIILTLSPKIGFRIGYRGIALEPYYRLDYVHDFLNNDWNMEAWSNNTKYGPGIRLSLGGVTGRTDTSFYLYFEYVNITYSLRTGWKSAGLSPNDFRIGINLWVPFGASKGSKGITY